LIDLFFKEGIVVDQFLFNDSCFRIAPPLTITLEEINEVSATILKCLDKLIST
jgi:4-aminobutyrate aminotransferase-like enzyme